MLKKCRHVTKSITKNWIHYTLCNVYNVHTFGHVLLIMLKRLINFQYLIALDSFINFFCWTLFKWNVLHLISTHSLVSASEWIISKPYIRLDDFYPKNDLFSKSKNIQILSRSLFANYSFNSIIPMVSFFTNNIMMVLRKYHPLKTYVKLWA